MIQQKTTRLIRLFALIIAPFLVSVLHPLFAHPMISRRRGIFYSLPFTAFAVTLVCTECATGQAPDSPQSRNAAFTMRVSTRESTFKPGAEITLDVEISNVTEKEIAVASWFDQLV